MTDKNTKNKNELDKDLVRNLFSSESKPSPERMIVAENNNAEANTANAFLESMLDLRKQQSAIIAEFTKIFPDTIAAKEAEESKLAEIGRTADKLKQLQSAIIEITKLRQTELARIDAVRFDREKSLKSVIAVNCHSHDCVDAIVEAVKEQSEFSDYFTTEAITKHAKRIMKHFKNANNEALRVTERNNSIKYFNSSLYSEYRFSLFDSRKAYERIPAELREYLLSELNKNGEPIVASYSGEFDGLLAQLSKPVADALRALDFDRRKDTKNG